ncbi:MAG: Eco57I restriction-modification methylase domain-containing protein [Anaerolineales bacterium]|nr:MAG: Eco57I restriction-modification methylase domain-containing protein [Anaerolineales bacterium]
MNFEQTRNYLQDFAFGKLFIEILGWGSAKGIKALDLKVEDIQFELKPISEMAGVVVFEASAADGILPNKKVMAAVHKEVTKFHHENLLIFLNKDRTQSLWHWVKREERRLIPRDHLFVKGQPGDLFLSKLSSMFVDISELDDDGNLPVVEALGRLKKALDIQPVTKKFYTDFANERLEFIELIEGIDNDKDRRWYASVLLNRLMFIYFLQGKGFLNNGDLDYLQKKMEESKKRGKDRYYSEFLKALFFEGFAKPEEKRSDVAKKMLGKIRYLNGGLFLPHALEADGKYNIRIPDKAFENVLALFRKYSWNLDDTPGGKDDEINPDVLGYIFEKYINQKAFGAYYTRTEITEHLCERTIYPVILQKVNTPGLAGVLKERNFETITDLLTHLDAPLCKQLLNDVLPTLSILDPACGSGAFLVAAMRTLIDVYSAIIGRIPFLNDKALNDWLKKTQEEHPSLAYFIKRSIITDNLYGVDIMEEATEIARLRLFLALVASVRTVDELEPLPNIDFNILPGNSLIGMLRVNEEAFNQKMGSPSAYEQGSLMPNYKQSGLFQQKTYRQIVNEKKAALDAYRHASSLTEDLRALRDTIQTRRRDDYALLSDMLVDEFKALEIKFEQAVWDDKKKEVGKPKKRAVQIQDIQALEPFHWGYDFDEVMNQRGGFDVIITNPPWDIFKPNAKEFFAEHSDLVTKKKMTIEEFEDEYDKLIQQEDIRNAWFDYLNSFPHVSAYYRSAKQFANQISIVNGKKAGSDINLYKLFVEQCFNLLRPQGDCGMVIPSGIYTDLGTKQLREMLFGQTTITGLFCFENRKEIFEGVHRSFKFVVLTFGKQGQTKQFPAMFMRHNAEELAAFPAEHAMQISVPLVRRLSPDSLSIMEFKGDLDIHIAEKMLKFPLLGEEIERTWKLTLASEFHMTNDSYLFKTQIGKGRFPLYEGKMIWQFENKYSEPRYWIVEQDGASALGEKRGYQHYRIGFRDISASTNERATIATVLPKNVFVGNTINLNVPTEKSAPNNAELLFIVSFFNSFVFDWLIRQKITSHLNFFYVYQMPVPRLSAKDPAFAPIVERAAKLICTTPEFDDLAKEVGLGSHKKGVTDPKVRAQLRAQLDGMIAHLYGLTESEFAHILSTFPLVGEDVKSAAMVEFRKMGN